MVFIHHYNPFISWGDSVFNFFNEFYVGVNFFFVLSGFLITHRYYDRNVSFKVYFIRRFARVYPMFFILTSLTFLLIAVQSAEIQEVLGVYTVNILFLKGLFKDFLFSGVPQAWTLTVEEMFYFSAPLIFILIKKGGWKVLVFLPVGLLIIGCALVALSSGFDWFGFFHDYRFMLIYTFFGRSTEFIVGVVLALIYRKYQYQSNRMYFTIGGVIGIVLSIGLMSLQRGNNLYGLESLSGLLINSLLLPCFIAVFYWGLITEQTLMNKILRSPVFSLLGRSSYTFYLIHLGFIAAFIDQHVNALILFILLNITAIGLYFFVERVLNTKIRQWA